MSTSHPMQVPLFLVIATALAAGHAFAQKLPPPSREVFRCELGGKVSYSDAPCLGAKKVDVEPTRGLTSTGKESAGADVRREHFNEGFAEAIKPLTGKSAKQLSTDSKRFKLPATAQRECRELDIAIPEAETTERTAAPEKQPHVQRNLLTLRQRSIQLGC